MDNRIINSLWIGDELSKLELLTLHSFTRAGHEFHLWVYQPLKNELPTGVVLKNAQEILPRKFVFSYLHSSDSGHGKGSFAGFSDIFRYLLLYKTGGWWVDMDVTCLKYFDFNEDYFFRDHHMLEVVGNVMKCPKGSELMKKSFEETIAVVDENNMEWHKPIAILEKNIIDLGLRSYIRSGLSNSDKWFELTEKMILSNVAVNPEFYFIHWQNENWRSLGLNKNYVKYNTTVAMLMQKMDLLPRHISAQELMRNKIYYSQMMMNLRSLGVWNE